MSLRGGGAVCRSQTHLQQAPEDDQFQIITEILNRCENIKSSSENAKKFKQSKELIDTQILWLIQSSQIAYDIQHQNYQQNQDNKVLQSQFELIKNSIIAILEAIKNLIDFQISLVIQLLSVCNLFSRLLLKLSINNTQYTLLQDDQIIKKHLDYIQSFLEFRNDQCKSIIEYQIKLIRMCVQKCTIQFKQNNPQNFIQQFLDDLTKKDNGFQPSSPQELDMNKHNLMNEEQLSFYIEESKSVLINQYQNGAGIDELKQILNQVYVELVLSSDKLTTKLSWTKIICELLSYQPYICKTKYNQFQVQYQLIINWEQAINQKLIIPVDQNSLYGLIQFDISNQNWDIFNKLMQTLEQLKSSLIKGCGSIGKLSDYMLQYEEFNDEQIRGSKKLQLYDLIDSLQINQIQNEYQEFSLKLQSCNNIFEGLLSDKINIQGHQIQKFQQFSRQLFKEYKELDYNAQIFDQKLQNISSSIQLSDGQITKNEKFNKFLIQIIFQQFFQVLKEIKWDYDLNTHILLFINMLSNIKNELIQDNTDEITLIHNQINNNNQNIELILTFIQNQTNQFYEEADLNNNLYLKLIIQFQNELLNIFKKDIRLLFLYHDQIALIEKFRDNQIKGKLQQIIIISQLYITLKQSSQQLVKKLIKHLSAIDQNSLRVKVNFLLKIDLQQTYLEFEDYMLMKNILSDFYNQIKGQSNFDKIQQSILILENLDLLFIKIQEKLEIKKSLTNSNINLIRENRQQIKFKELKLELELMKNLEKLRNFQDTQEDIKQIQLLIKERSDLIQIYLTDINHNEELEQLLLREIEQYQIWLYQRQTKQFFQQMIHKIGDNQQLIHKIQQDENQQINYIELIIDYYTRMSDMLESQIYLNATQQIQLQESGIKALKQYQTIYLNNQINDETYLQVYKIPNGILELKVYSLDYFFRQLNAKIEYQIDVIGQQQLILLKQSTFNQFFLFIRI